MYYMISKTYVPESVSLVSEESQKSHILSWYHMTGFGVPSVDEQEGNLQLLNTHRKLAL